MTCKEPPPPHSQREPLFKSFFIARWLLAQCRHLTLIPQISDRVDLVLVGNNPVPKCKRNKHAAAIFLPFPGLTTVIPSRRQKNPNSPSPAGQSKTGLYDSSYMGSHRTLKTQSILNCIRIRMKRQPGFRFLPYQELAKQIVSLPSAQKIKLISASHLWSKGVYF